MPDTETFRRGAVRVTGQPRAGVDLTWQVWSGHSWVTLDLALIRSEGFAAAIRAVGVVDDTEGRMV